MVGVSTRAISRANSVRIMEALRSRGPSSRADLAGALGVSVSTVSRLVASLMAAQLVETLDERSATGGRPLNLLRLHPAAGTTLAVDVADHHTEVALVAIDGSLTSCSQHPAAHITNPNDRLEHTLAVIDEAYAAARDSSRCLAVGVSIPGPVTAAGVVTFAPALNWHNLPLGPMLSRRLGVPVAVANDANLIAIAESRCGAHADAGSLFVVAAFDGIGSGIVVDRTLWPGYAGCSGQIGRMLLNVDALSHVYVGFGDLERQLGSVGVADRAARLGLTLPADREVFAALFADTDPRAVSLTAAVLDEFAAALVNVCALLDPEVIVLAGRFAPLADRLADEFGGRLVGRVLHVPLIAPTSTPYAGTLVGAAQVGFDALGSLEQLLDD